ncbi:STAS domain-containing protein [Streptomyces sp. NPDC005931]|uniref:STAS domain-containing protein n=1 Tax=Streptomyces sp. NPDC005931 TaxID=3364737 RepID=UPI0036D0E8B5
MPSDHGASHPQLPFGQPTTSEDISVVTLHGDIDHYNAAHLSDTLLYPHGTATARTVIDLSAVTFIDSTAINAFIAAHHAARQSGGWLHLAGLTASVLSTVQLIGLDQLIPCYPALYRDLTS